MSGGLKGSSEGQFPTVNRIHINYCQTYESKPKTGEPPHQGGGGTKCRKGWASCPQTISPQKPTLSVSSVIFITVHNDFYVRSHMLDSDEPQLKYAPLKR